VAEKPFPGNGQEARAEAGEPSGRDAGERGRCLDLYGFAPVGYLTVSDAGLIVESNLTGAALLGIERGKRIGRPGSSRI
jgi:hypothetical protein